MSPLERLPPGRAGGAYDPQGSMDYTVRIRQTPSGEWTASAEGMPGCAAKGNSREVVLEEMKKAINLYVQGLLEEAIDEPNEGETQQAEVVTLSV
jgi:predicted RNase H-like HicB family nuclease